MLSWQGDNFVVMRSPCGAKIAVRMLTAQATGNSNGQPSLQSLLARLWIMVNHRFLHGLLYIRWILLPIPMVSLMAGLRANGRYSSLLSHRLLMDLSTGSRSWLEPIVLEKSAPLERTELKRGVADIAAISATLLGRSGCTGCTCMRGTMVCRQVAPLNAHPCWPSGSLFIVITSATKAITNSSGLSGNGKTQMVLDMWKWQHPKTVSHFVSF